MLDVSIWSAALGGLIVFFSPCVLPIVPFYLSYMAGTGMSEINGDGDLAPGVRRRAVLSAIMFSLGIVTVFVLLGAAAFSLSQAFRGWQTEFRLIAATVVFVMGLHFLGVFRIGFLNRQFQVGAGDTKRMTVWGSYVVGLAFAAGWTPCVGGVLTAVVFTASTEATALRGLMLMTVFGLFMTAPFVVAAAFIRPFLKFASRFRRHLGKVEKAMGVLLIVFAVLIATDRINYIAQWMLNVMPAYQSL
ncbi:cytochrome C biogenesis protein CcdA [Pacificitalea manganoxidans]|uniref:Cytochrome C biogenesis protein CcdA n=1 Tax=Pacificitalea manganoxidans TaxID=1411902 RepID=A0A291M080_9RHOB|nr:cytochrome c biogenesis protein CcdA [Pacificitalea manganoxidans]MAQ46510.1 cytochrome C biogenesis protein CcdA [Actibacterium sp.]OWU71902.1 sulfur oxidation protein [Roseovarius sp. 22II1-1F6A]ATI42403.1 cytochrome C biogenesis protein CcdA [Pacificitalea manganoxidans]MBF53481.1 cytochrome C biogenesis protein CcdA [Actibacterium sp.]MDR6307755.1 cytochrome c-type biogenesis protein [Pacificitalea manganoxidans]|tara:strand:+ start:185 stop:922 length:738 start_codon:yes stop_codon:yes gene_type:complete